MPKTSAEVRNAFLSFFAKNGHEVVASGPVTAPNDPTLMFANAGMVQFKDLFLGKEQRVYKRATSSQKCIRISGKHNDLENVGPSPRHHTFFEMLGNFSFGDYFKEQAIVLAWEFVQSLGLPRERLAVTYFGGEAGVPADLEARDLWKRVSGLPDAQLIGLGMKDNFWSMGDTGPCGPCSELHYYLGSNPDISQFGEEQTPEGYGWIEFWNLVFMQFDRDASGRLNPLPAPSIDTGMGLERMALIAQGKTSNYETDLLRELVDAAARISKKPYRGTMSPDDVSMRVIADHARLTAFLLAEGVMPDANGREYVLRRVMRRAIRHGHRLGIAQPFLHEIARDVTRLMGDQYPELLEKADHIAAVAEQEEVRFRKTIERGLVLLDERFTHLGAGEVQVLAGADAFKLYDTFGFPLDLTEVICRERGFDVDHAGYEAALEEARRRSDFKGLERAVEGVYRQALQVVGDRGVAFSGYQSEQASAPLLAIIQGGALVQALSNGEAELVFATTPFYAEAGGQLGDQGWIRTASAEFCVADTTRPIPGLTVHRGKLHSGSLRIGEEATLAIDVERRNAIRRNHSATHLLHHALREILGPHAQQKGSQVGPERLRFDFTHNAPVTREQINQIEDLVNRQILRNVPIVTETLSLNEARGRGAMMLFGEKYGDEVRVLSMAESVELCGGTHASFTGDIGLLKITGEQGVAAGVRRLTATTGGGTIAYLRELEATLNRASELVKSSNSDLPTRVEKLVQSERGLEKKLAELQRKLASGGGESGADPKADARDYGGVKVLGLQTEVTDRGALRELAEQLRDQLGRSVVLVVSIADGKAQMVLTVAKELTARYPAGQLIRPVAAAVGGTGGGRPDMAQAGGPDVAQVPQAIAALYAAFE
jgi:alanyl-tRNA synthetase